MPNPIRRRRLGGSSYPTLAANFVQASSQYAKIASNASLQMGSNTNFTFACWFYPVNTTSEIVSKSSGAGTREYRVEFATTSCTFNVSSDGTTETTVSSGGGSITTNAWNFLVCWYDGVNINAQVNLGTIGSVAFSAGAFTGAAEFDIGARNSGVSSFLGGRLDCVGLWKQALSAADRARLYAGSIGLAYRDLSGSLLTSLQAWYDLDGNFNDASGNGNHLTPINSPTFTTGKR